MKTKRSAWLIACLLCLAVLLCACGGTEPKTDAFSVEALEGFYVEQIAQRGTLLLDAEDAQTARIVIEWPDSAAVSYRWELTGHYDPEAKALVYSDAVLIERAFDPQGEENDAVLYTHGTGSFAKEGDKLLWTDNEETGSGKSAFLYEMSLADYQASQLAAAQVQESPEPAEPEATPAPTPEPTPTAAAENLPIITKSPTDETVAVGGNCSFVARYENAVWAVWHFVSPDGQTDLTYEEASQLFPTLEIINGMYSTMKLRNIPAELNGWRVYCRYTNKFGDMDTKSALITVTDAPAPTPTPAASLGPVANEWSETQELNAAVSGSGVDFTAPAEDAVPAGLQFLNYRYQAGVLELNYAAGAESPVLTIRKSPSRAGTDLSGDYNSYSRVWNLTLNGLTLRCLGDEATVNTATFDVGTDHFSISCNPGQPGQGLTVAQLNALIEAIR